MRVRGNLISLTTGRSASLPGDEMVSQAVAMTKEDRFGQTSRSDAWWASPLVVFLGLSAFIVYATWASLQGEHYRFGPYLSPFYSPELWGSPHAWFGTGRPAWYPGWLLFSPAFLVMWLPAGFRLTCYYYRGAYYKAFWADPPACAVGEPRKHYWGENSFPLLLQNVHRYFLYLAMLLLLILASDAWHGLWFPRPDGRVSFGIGIGTLVLTINVVLLGGYTLGCHSLRHLCGGRIDRISECPFRGRLYRGCSMLNGRHMAWAWTSLVWVAFTDLYIRLCSMGVISDWRILF
jgi:hypothetical protein